MSPVNEAVYDVLSIGFGPANLALAIALQEEAEERDRDLRRLFLDSKLKPAWHPGILIEGSLIQISVLQDLVTVRNSRSRFTFLKRYLYEASVRGRCSHCGNPLGGNLCEDCGRTNDCTDLLDPVCSQCGAPPSRRIFTRPWFPLSHYTGFLREHWETVAMGPGLRALCGRRHPRGRLGNPGPGSGIRKPADLRLVRDGAALPHLRLPPGRWLGALVEVGGRGRGAVLRLRQRLLPRCLPSSPAASVRPEDPPDLGL